MALLPLANPASAPSTYYLFFTALAAGCGAPLLLVPVEAIGRRFFILLTLVALLSYSASILLAGLWVHPLHLAGAALLLAYNVTLPRKGGRLSRALLAAATLLGFAGLAADAHSLRAGLPGLAGGEWLLPATALASSLSLGSALAAMVLGHWYLVLPGLSFSHLRRLVLLLLGALALRASVLGAALIAEREHLVELWEERGAAAFGVSYGFFLGAYALFGLLAPAVLGGMSLVCVRERSNRSATGILYVAVVFVLLGEIIAKHLLATAGVLV